MAKERNRAAKVIQQLTDRVEVEHKGERLTVPMKGFPPGFTLNAGARVILVDEDGGVVARPLVRAVRTPAVTSDAVARRAPLDVEGRRVEFQAGTAVNERSDKAAEAAGGEYHVWVVDGTDQAIAVRRD